MSKQIAQTIIHQLGGFTRLNIMLGLKDVIAYENGVSFKIKARGKANYVKIILNGLDLYDVEIGKIKGLNYNQIAHVENVGVENLKSTIEEFCGLALSL